MAYEKKTIINVIEDIDSKKIYLPAIQRKYVWGENQITRLMDSIMRGYPFGTFLFWKVKKTTVNDKNYSMYEFIKDYHERDNFKNQPAGFPFSISDSNKNETILSALDGQQRLTSLYIALKGSVSYKLPNKRKAKDDSYPKKELYFNLLSGEKLEEEDISYCFSFLTPDKAKICSEKELWYKVKDIVRFQNRDALTEYILDSEWKSNKTIRQNLLLLFSRFKEDEIINYFEVASDSIDDVLDIFVRVNSGGTVLSKTDLLFSTIVSYWNEGREEIDNLLSKINKIGNHYSFSNDFIMRACLYVMDLPITLKVESFGQNNVKKIKDNWEDIKVAITDTIECLNDLGFYEENIVADNAVLPIIYYRYKYGNSAFKNDTEAGTRKVIFDEKMEIRKYMVISQIRHIFGQSTNSTLTTIRTELKKYQSKFQLEQLQKLTFSGDRSLVFDDEDIENWFDLFEKGAYTFILLTLLYPSLRYGQKEFDQDHMHPGSCFDKEDDLRSLELPTGRGTMNDEKIVLWKHQRNTLANLQILERRENESKNDLPLVDWLNIPANKETVKFLPQGINYSLSNFDEFLEKRKELMLEELKRILL